MRPLRHIAREIYQTWPEPNYGAIPYLDAMSMMNSIHENYFADTGEYVVRYFLANAGTWRGEDARRIKAELKGMLNESR